MDIDYLTSKDEYAKRLTDGKKSDKACREQSSASERIPYPFGQVRSRRAASISAAISCLILCGISLCLHLTAAVDAVCALRDGWQNRLVCIIFPSIEFSRDSDSDITDHTVNNDTEDGDSEKSSVTEYNFIDEDLSSTAKGGISISNETEYTPDTEALMASPTLPVALGKFGDSREPLVLIYHTHGTEAYADTADSGFRSRDIENNTVAVGGVIADVLRENGIGVIHLTEMFDSENWSAAYDKSTLAVRSVMAENPTIKYVFDIHRDCIGNGDVGYIRSLTTIDGEDAAQLMIVCGTDSGGSSHTGWRDNLSFALTLQTRLWKADNTLMRPIDLRCASFYQDTSPCALLMEFGTCANTLTEAKRSAVMFACVLSNYISDGDCSPDYGEMADIYCN